MLSRSPIKNAMTLARDTFSALDKHWKGEQGGMNRPGYSVEENEAIEVIAGAAKSMGMTGLQDLAGNVHFIYRGKNPKKPVFMMGSHLDAVPQGGRYDGPAGVVAGLAAINAIHTMNITPPQDICLTVWRNEESPWFGQFAVGSKLACGMLSAEFLKAAQKQDGRSLESHMSDIGLMPQSLVRELSKGEGLLPADKIASLVEVHIEQGSQLARSDKSLGVVTGIRGNLRYPKRIDIFGNAGHSGAVPQNERRDAVLAGAAILGAFEDICKAEEAKGNDLVWSCPIATTGDNASPTTIPDFFSIQPEVRSLLLDLLERVSKNFESAAQKIANDYGVKIDLKPDDRVIGKPSPVSDNLQEFLSRICAEFDIAAQKMPSGAGHDASILAQSGVNAGMIFLRHGNEGVSHRPDEIMTMNAGEDPFSFDGDFANAVRVLTNAAAYDHTDTYKTSSGDDSFASGLLKRGAFTLF